MSNALIGRSTVVADPPVARFLFSDTRMALVWLIVGAFTGIAAVSGAFLNMNFLLAGSASTNPVLLLLGVVLVLAWKTAGYIGLDRFLLPILGTPWKAPRVDRHVASSVLVSA